MSKAVKWGIYDTTDKCWMGNEKGPLAFTDTVVNGKAITGELLARMAMTIINEQFKTSIRFRKRELPDGINKVKDSLKAPMTAVQALKRIEARV